MVADRTWVVERAKALGFDLCGVVRADEEKFPELENFAEWLERGYAAEMNYLEDPRRAEPSLLMQDLRSVIVCGLNYNTAHPSECNQRFLPSPNLPLGPSAASNRSRNSNTAAPLQFRSG